MKIGFVLDDSLDNPDGVQQYVLTLSSWLKTKGHEVHFLVGETKRKDIPNVHSLAKNIKVSFNKNKLSIPRPADKNKIKQLLEREQFDILHVQTPYSPQLVGRIINLAPKGTKIISTFHIFPASKIVHAGAKALSRVTSKSMQKIDAYISVSVPAKNFMLSTTGITSQVIPNMVEIIKSSSNIVKNKQKKIVFLGRLVERKGAKYLLTAFARLQDKNVQLIIGGKGPLEMKLKKMAKDLNITDRVKFAGFIDNKNKTKFLAQADIAVFPSTGGESFGIVLLEAMSAGSGVVIAGNNPGYASTMNDNPLVLFDPYKTQQLADLMDKLLSDKTLSKSLHDWQSGLVKTFDVEVIGPKILNVYEQALNKLAIK